MSDALSELAAVIAQDCPCLAIAPAPYSRKWGENPAQLARIDYYSEDKAGGPGLEPPVRKASSLCLGYHFLAAVALSRAIWILLLASARAWPTLCLPSMMDCWASLMAFDISDQLGCRIWA